MGSRFTQNEDNELFVQGNLDVYSVAEVLRQGAKLIRSNQTYEVIDLQHVEKMDSAGLAFVIELSKIAKTQGKILEFKNIPARIRAVADVYGLSDLLAESAFQSE